MNSLGQSRVERHEDGVRERNAQCSERKAFFSRRIRREDQANYREDLWGSSSLRVASTRSEVNTRRGSADRGNEVSKNKTRTRSKRKREETREKGAECLELGRKR